jgi:hypothetical protein
MPEHPTGKLQVPTYMILFAVLWGGTKLRLIIMEKKDFGNLRVVWECVAIVQFTSSEMYMKYSVA